MLVSYDTIFMMNQLGYPPYRITNRIVSLITEISHHLGKIEGPSGIRIQPQLRKSNRIKTIQGSLAIEGNTLDLKQVSAVLDGKRVIAPAREILEVKNANRIYEQLTDFSVASERDFLRAHKILMNDLIDTPGRYRKNNVGILTGSKITHMAPQAKLVSGLMKQLFSFIKKDRDTSPLIKAAVFHYETEFIHPFKDGNGRMGRLWQSVVLSTFNPLFQFIPQESLIKANQQKYYRVLGQCDHAGESTAFIEFSLALLLKAVKEFASTIQVEPLTTLSRLETAAQHFGKMDFSRKDYLAFFKMISTATASRDLRAGVEKKALVKRGDKASSRYKFT